MTREDVLLVFALSIAIHGTDEALRGCISRLKPKVSSKIRSTMLLPFEKHKQLIKKVQEVFFILDEETINVGTAYRKGVSYDILLTAADFDIDLREGALIDTVHLIFRESIGITSGWLGVQLRPDFGFTGILHTRWLDLPIIEHNPMIN